MHPVSGPGGKFAATGATSPVAVDTGWAMVANKIVYNSASVNVTVATPAVSARKDRIVLRFTWATETADILLIQSAEGAGDYADYTTAAYQTDGTAWTIPLWKVDITTGGAITLTDERTPISGSFYILNANIRDSAGLSVIGRAANTTGDVADITAASDGQVLRRSGTSIGFGTVATAGIADDAVTAAKVADGAIDAAAKIANDVVDSQHYAAGSIDLEHMSANSVAGDQYVDGSIYAPHIAVGQITATHIANDNIIPAAIGAMVPAFLGRQGGSATDWGTAGTNNYTSGINIRAQGGSIVTAVTGIATLTFPVAFSAVPIVVATHYYDGSGDMYIIAVVSPTAAGCQLWALNGAGSMAGAGEGIHWLAIGPE